MLEGAAACEGCHGLIVIRDNVSYDVIIDGAYKAGNEHVCKPVEEARQRN